MGAKFVFVNRIENVEIFACSANGFFARVGILPQVVEGGQDAVFVEPLHNVNGFA